MGNKALDSIDFDYITVESIDKFLNVFSLCPWMFKKYFCDLEEPKVWRHSFLWLNIGGHSLRKYILYLCNY